MSMRFIASAALALGLSGAVPTIASADRRPDARTETRAPVANVEHREAGRQENRRPIQVDHRDLARHDDHRDADDRRGRSDYRDRDDHREWNQPRDWNQHRDRDDNWGRVGVYVPAPVYTPDFCTPVNVQSVPRCVLDTACRVEPGLPIESVDYVRQGGSLFYSVRMERARSSDVTVRVSVDGALVGIL
ncbi:MAG: hypothetical protein JWM97_1213 [Phycisphaerales bacterium]|nr:hypothetical protein [Phycisphaerales bacterium]MDB5303664.1 hypothetical protein [Phycisphaerales bacterium]